MCNLGLVSQEYLTGQKRVMFEQKHVWPDNVTGACLLQ